jgi:hypothetical protein
MNSSEHDAQRDWVRASLHLAEEPKDRHNVYPLLKSFHARQRSAA